MHINADFSQRVVLDTNRLIWRASPMAGVDRRMLDRMGDEVARATSIVRYAPGSSFSAHTHDGGEEFVVLEGVFQDEHGDFPAGTYVRNPPTSKHTPGSADGCVIFVKLWQFDPDDRHQMSVPIERSRAESVPGEDGIHRQRLFESTNESVEAVFVDPGATLRRALAGGGELLLLDGSGREGDDELVRHSWLRLPEHAALDFTAGTNGASVWLKSGHLLAAHPSAHPYEATNA